MQNKSFVFDRQLEAVIIEPLMISDLYGGGGLAYSFLAVGSPSLWYSSEY